MQIIFCNYYSMQIAYFKFRNFDDSGWIKGVDTKIQYDFLKMESVVHQRGVLLLNTK